MLLLINVETSAANNCCKFNDIQGDLSIVNHDGDASLDTISDKQPMISMRALWTVSGYVIGEHPAWGDSEAKALLFKPLDIDKSQIVFDGQVCSKVAFEETIVDTVEYLDEVWHVNSQSLGITDAKIYVSKTDCNIPGFDEYIRLSDGRLIVKINGIFFFLEPSVQY